MAVSLPRARIESFSDLVFGLALSIGALSLIGRPTTDTGIMTGDILGFAYSFLLLTSVWIRYTAVASSIPMERPLALRLNVGMLFLVVVEPFLFNYAFVLRPPSPADPFYQFTTALFAVDFGALLAILAGMEHVALRLEATRAPPEKLETFRAWRRIHVVSAAFFLVSALPWFGIWMIGSLTARTALWLVPLVVLSTWRRGVWVARRLTRKGAKTGAREEKDSTGEPASPLRPT